jgi:hypothetical protein
MPPSPLAGLPTAPLTSAFASDYQLMVYTVIRDLYALALAAENAAWEALPHERDGALPVAAQAAWEYARGYTEGVAAVREMLFARELALVGTKETGQ